MDDYQSDIRFGDWLRKQRTKSGFSVEQAAQATGIELPRLKSLEMGYADRGITRPEAVKLAAQYKLLLDEFLRRAEES